MDEILIHPTTFIVNRFDIEILVTSYVKDQYKRKTTFFLYNSLNKYNYYLWVFLINYFKILNEGIRGKKFIQFISWVTGSTMDRISKCSDHLNQSQLIDEGYTNQV